MDTTVYFIKVNEVYGKIQCECFDTVVAVREAFSFYADGYKFSPEYKNKMWDGKIRMIDETGIVRLGLWTAVKQFCESVNIPFKLDPQICRQALSRDYYETFVDNLNVHTGGDKIDPYYYQKDSAHFALEMKRCLLLSPTSSGKSLIQYLLMRAYEKILPGQKLLIVVPTVGLVSQMIGDFDDYSSEIEWNAKDKMHGIKSGVSKETDKHLIVSTYQSLRKMPEEWFHQFAAICVDEVHTATSDSIIRIMDNAVNATWRVGLTGTLDECKTNHLILQGMFGLIKQVITTKELMDQGKVAKLKIHVGLLKYNDDACRFLRSAPRPGGGEDKKTKKRKANYAEEIEYIINHVERNKLIMRLAASLSGNTIIMINQVEHGEKLFKWMSQAYPNKKIYLYTGSTKAEERDKIRHLMENEDGSIIIGSLGVLSTGISIKRLHNLLLCHPSKSRIKVLQSVGRILRKSKYGNEVTLFDLVDDFRIGAYENYVYIHGQKRVQYYCDQQFEYYVKEIPVGN